MDKRATLIILKDKKKAKKFAEKHFLSKKLRRSILKRRAELIENEYNEVMDKLEEEE